MDKKTKSQKKIMCAICKKEHLSFYLHECKRAVQEYYGCINCDDWCISCKPDWNNHDKKK